MASPDIHKGAVFWLDAENQTANYSGKGHYWVVLVVSGEKFLWVPLSSFKSWLDPESTYVFNVGKANKYISALKDTCPFFRFAEILSVSEIERRKPQPRAELPAHHVDGISEALIRSGETPQAVSKFLSDAIRRMKGKRLGDPRPEDGGVS